MNETTRGFNEKLADHLTEVERDQRVTPEMFQAYLVSLLLADEHGVIKQAGYQEMVDLMLNTGVMSWERIEDEDGAFTIVEWTPR